MHNPPMGDKEYIEMFKELSGGDGSVSRLELDRLFHML